MSQTDILFPPSRLIGGSLYTGVTKDDKGQPLTFSDGSPRTQYSFGIAIPKGQEQHWNQTPWGAKLWQAGASAWPAIHQTPTFAWKVKDGDSTVPNKKGNRPCDQEGHPGHWIVWLSGSFAPRITKDQGRTEFIEPNAVKPGYWVEVFANTASNNRNDSPGMYLNYSVINFVGYDTEIQLANAVDATAVGFGQQAAPAHVSAAPVATMQQPPAPAAAPIVASQTGEASVAPAAPIQPHTAYMAPAAPAAPVAAPFPPAGWTAHPDAPGYFYRGQEVLSEAQLRAQM